MRPIQSAHSSSTTESWTSGIHGVIFRSIGEGSRRINRVGSGRPSRGTPSSGERQSSDTREALQVPDAHESGSVAEKGSRPRRRRHALPGRERDPSRNRGRLLHSEFLRRRIPIRTRRATPGVHAELEHRTGPRPAIRHWLRPPGIRRAESRRRRCSGRTIRPHCSAAY